ncbi:MAG: molybdopterin-dependent oxidoreductase [Phycisphaerales bacterium]
MSQDDDMTQGSRRLFLADSVKLGAASLIGWSAEQFLIDHTLAALIDAPSGDPFARGERIGTLRFDDRKRSSRPRGKVYGRGLNGRLRRDLSALTPDSLITPNERFFIRTRCPDRIDYTKPWTIRIHGLLRKPIDIPVHEIASRAQPMGVHLLECAGSGLGGLISAATWSGVPVSTVLSRANALAQATRIRISGFDDHSKFDSGYDERGADWIFTLDQLTEAGAFLATQMNGVALPRDHGYPIRLVVPGWYGCTCIKWLDEIEFVDDTASVTRHMRHFARRTHQVGVPRLAKDFQPAEIDLAAMPVHVEKWRIQGKIVYRVVGILWGGRQTTDALVIRFNANETYVPVESYEHETTKTWTLWTHTWHPPKPGKYVIQLQVDEPATRTRRLDRGAYQRIVRVEEVS